jgi:hypothetical protein
MNIYQQSLARVTIILESSTQINTLGRSETNFLFIIETVVVIFGFSLRLAVQGDKCEA